MYPFVHTLFTYVSKAEADICAIQVCLPFFLSSAYESYYMCILYGVYVDCREYTVYVYFIAFYYQNDAGHQQPPPHMLSHILSHRHFYGNSLKPNEQFDKIEAHKI